jgi:hypothetical protein
MRSGIYFLSYCVHSAQIWDPEILEAFENESVRDMLDAILKRIKEARP